mgnify:CR=1 FL=1
MDHERHPEADARVDTEPVVTVAGGGPVGAMLALELGRRGVPTLLLDDRSTIEHRPKAQLVNARSMEHFRRLDLADELRTRAPLPATWPMSVIFAESLTGRELHRFEVPSAAELRRFPLGAEPPQRVPQYVVEELLREAVAACPLVQRRFGVQVTDVTHADDHVVATYRDERGHDRAVRSRWLVGADGARSTVRERLGIALDGTPGPVAQLGIFFRSAELKELHDKGPAVFYFVVGGRQPGLLGPVDAHDRWWFQVAGLDPATDVATLDPSQILRAAVGRDFPHEVTAVVPWRWGLFLARRFGSGRVWLAGDAVHQHPPTGGFGMNTGIGDAVDLGWKLAACHAGWGGPALLASYETERRPIAARVIEEAGANMRGLGRTLRAATSPAGDEIARNTGKEFATFGIQLGYRYARSPIVVGDGTPEPPWETSTYEPSAWPGCRLPHAWLAPGHGPGASLYDRLGPWFTLLDLGGEPHATGALRAAFDTAGVPLAVVHVDDPTLHRQCAADLVLVRPDQHVAWRGATLDRARAAIVCATVTGHVPR